MLEGFSINFKSSCDCFFLVSLIATVLNMEFYLIIYVIQTLRKLFFGLVGWISFYHHILSRAMTSFIYEMAKFEFGESHYVFCCRRLHKRKDNYK